MVGFRPFARPNSRPDDVDSAVPICRQPYISDRYLGRPATSLLSPSRFWSAPAAAPRLCPCVSPADSSVSLLRGYIHSSPPLPHPVHHRSLSLCSLSDRLSSAGRTYRPLSQTKGPSRPVLSRPYPLTVPYSTNRVPVAANWSAPRRGATPARPPPPAHSQPMHAGHRDGRRHRHAEVKPTDPARRAESGR